MEWLTKEFKSDIVHPPARVVKLVYVSGRSCRDLYRMVYYSRMPGRKRSWTTEQLKKSVKKARSYRQVLAALGLRQAGGNYAQIKKYIKELNLDHRHFKGRGWNRGLRGLGKPLIPLEKILVRGSTFQTFKLKNRLLAAGLKPQHCEQCNWAKRTPDGHLPLELDHVNGDSTDHRLENLRVLCPNCHSLTPTHRGRQQKKIGR